MPLPSRLQPPILQLPLLLLLLLLVHGGLGMVAPTSAGRQRCQRCSGKPLSMPPVFHRHLNQHLLLVLMLSTEGGGSGAWGQQVLHGSRRRRKRGREWLRSGTPASPMLH